ncbi:hypothetical protein K1719_039134 [Acacia pycnantha]|nr:hypothetical protein K1719_039134 [Acacia pycnantha]
MHERRDVGLVGPEFTWKRGTTEARLDRILANDQWANLFPNASVTHRPLLLHLDKDTHSSTSNRPFRFIAAWVLLAQFDEFVRINRAVTRYGLLPKYKDLQLGIWNELEDVLLQESLIWAQKATVKWSVYGDRNTRYRMLIADENLNVLRLSRIVRDHGSMTPP